LFNHDNYRHDFTYIDDIVEGVIRMLNRPAPLNPECSCNRPDPGTCSAPWRVYNIGNNRTVDLMDYIGTLEKALGKEANRVFLPIQLGVLPDTWANVDYFVE
jgi:UDP-glucuronate 4-epimerase